MTPEQISMAASVLSLLKIVGGWPIGLIILAMIIAVFLTPWWVIVVISRGQDRRASAHDLRTVELVNEIKGVFTEALNEQKERFDAMAQMYQDNVLLVKGYEKLACDLANIIHLNTQTNTKLVEKINNNHYCPVVRQKSGSANNG